MTNNTHGEFRKFIRSFDGTSQDSLNLKKPRGYFFKAITFLGEITPHIFSRTTCPYRCIVSARCLPDTDAVRNDSDACDRYSIGRSDWKLSGWFHCASLAFETEV